MCSLHFVRVFFKIKSLLSLASTRELSKEGEGESKGSASSSDDDDDSDYVEVEAAEESSEEDGEDSEDSEADAEELFNEDPEVVERTIARNLQATAKAPVVKETSLEKEPLRYSLNEQFQRNKRPSIVRGQGQVRRKKFNDALYCFTRTRAVREAWKNCPLNETNSKLPKRKHPDNMVLSELRQAQSGAKTYFTALRSLWKYLDVRGLHLYQICLLKYLPGSQYPVITPSVLQEFINFMSSSGEGRNSPHCYVADVYKDGKLVHKKGDHIKDRYGQEMFVQGSWRSEINVKNLQSALNLQLLCGGYKTVRFEFKRNLTMKGCEVSVAVGNPLNFPPMEDYIKGVISDLGKFLFTTSHRL